MQRHKYTISYRLAYRNSELIKKKSAVSFEHHCLLSPGLLVYFIVVVLGSFISLDAFLLPTEGFLRATIKSKPYPQYLPMTWPLYLHFS